MPHAHDHVNVSDSASAGVPRGAQAHDHVNVSDSGETLVDVGLLTVVVGRTTSWRVEAAPTPAGRRLVVDTDQMTWIFGAVGAAGAVTSPVLMGHPGLQVVAMCAAGGWAAWKWSQKINTNKSE